MVARPPAQLTHINTEDALIKIWGIVEHERHAMLQNIIAIHTDRLNQGFGMPRGVQNELIPGKLVLVQHAGQYKRAQIIRAEPVQSTTRKVLLRLVDVGPVISARVDEIRDISEVPHFKVLDDTPLAEDFVLADVVKSAPWSAEDSEWANRVLQFNSQVSVTDVIAGKALLNVIVNDSRQNCLSYSSCLVKRGIAKQVGEEQFRLIVLDKYGMEMPNNQFHVPPPQIPNLTNVPRQPFGHSMTPPVGSLSPPMAPNFIPPALSGLAYSRTRSPKSFIQPLPQQKPLSAPAPQILPRQFGVETLKPGSTHEVYVSHVIDGMQSFTVQLKKNVDEKLTKLMARINSINPKPISTALLPGTMCLGRFSEDKTLCRAVVSTVLSDGANLYFVDFGNSEIAAFGDIYEIPPEFIQEDVMALRFTLANLGNSFALTTQEAQRTFEELVENAEKLMMQVMPPEMPLKQYCELFLVDKGKTINVKQKVLDKVKLMKPAEYKKIPFKQNGVADVIVSYVESPIRFFVQLEMNQSMLELLMNAVEEYCLSSDMKELLYVEDVNENMAVCALYSADNKWYRGLIMDEPDNAGNVQVFYVDYGNQEECHFSKLRMMNNEMISKFPMQAIECRLDIDPDFGLREDVVSFFVDFIDTNPYTMKVLNVLPAHVLLVELKDANDINVKDILFKQFDYSSLTALTITEPPSKHGQSQGNWRERNNSATEGDFSAFQKENIRSSLDTPPRNSFDSEEGRSSKFGKRRDLIDADETDDAALKSDNLWSKDGNESRGRFRNGPISDRPFKSCEDNWRSNREDREEELANSRPCGRRSGNDNWGINRDENANDSRSNWRRGGENGRNKWDEEKDRKPFFKRRDDDDNRRSDWESECGDRKLFRKRDGDSTWHGNRDDDSNDRRSGFRRNDWDSNRDSDRAGRRPFRGDDRDSKEVDWGANKMSTDDGRNSNPKFDRSHREDGWGGKPKFDRDNRGRDDRNSRHGGGFGERKWGSRDSAFKAPSVTLLDEYEKGANFVESNLQQGQQMDVIISWFTNPSQFFVMPADNPEFRTLMETIQEDYPQRKPVEISSLQPNDSVVARDKDDVIYRAKVLRTRPGAVLVSFVDYGNGASVRQGQVWTISADHCTIPVQAICCGLHNVLPASGNGWPEATNLDTYFGKEKYTISLIECQEERSSKTWLVNLVGDSGEDIVESMVADGVAVRNTVLQSEELYDLSLLRDQVLPVFLGHIESSKRFFVHIEPHKANSVCQMITDLTADPNNLTPLPVEKRSEGEFCLAPSDDEVYYRALILSTDESSQRAHILYVDYGDENDISFDKMKVLPDSLAICNIQIVECCLYEGESFTDEQAFSDALSEVDFMIKVMDIVDEKLLVYVYDINGARLPFPVEAEEMVPAICALPVLKRSEKVVISHIAQDKVYVQRAVDEAFILELNEKLAVKYDEEKAVKVSIEPDAYYAAKSGKFEAWYRCKLSNAESNEVFYIDYGNTEPVEELLATNVLDKDFFACPSFSAAVSTSVRFTIDDLSPLINAVEGVCFDATFERNVAGELSANLTETKSGKNFAQYVVESGCGCEIAKKSVGEPKTSYVAFADWRPDTERKVVVTHVASPTSFYVQSPDDANRVAVMQQGLQRALQKVLPAVGPVEGLCAAQIAADLSWRRARLSSPRGEMVFSVDFGVEFAPRSLKKLPRSYASDANIYIAECALNLEPVDDDVWSAGATERLAEITKNDGVEVVAKLEYAKNNKYVVELIVDGANVSETLINEGLARHKSFEVLVSHAVSLNEFYVQEAELEERLLALGDKLQEEADQWETVDAGAGEMVAAKFVDDGLWYRAVVLKKDEGGKTVKFIDYGNESSCDDEFRVLPEELKRIPAFAVRCSQHPLPDNYEELNDEFVNLVVSGEGSYKAYFLSYVEPKLVMLYVDDVSIDEALLQRATATLKEPCGAPQPRSDISVVAVSHVNTPSSFYAQPFNDTLGRVEALLADIENAEDVAEPMVGDIVAAQFPEDEVWYRVAVTDVGDAGAITAFFVDYGNSCVVERLRKLEETAKAIPFAAKHCSLLLPEGMDEWPEAANTRFVELAAQGETAFTLVIVEEGCPAVVDLLNNGNSVTKELIAASCAVAAPQTETSNFVAVCHINSPSSFYVQAENAALNELATLLADADAGDVIAETVVGNIVAALYPEDGMWYRARIVDNSDQRVVVLFVDYGNSCTVEKLRTLSERAKGLPHLAKHCAFSLPAGLERWPEAATKRLSELTCDGNTIFRLLVREEGDPAYVDLQENGVSVADELATLCRADLAAPVRETGNRSAVLSHVRDTGEIWIQYQTPHLDEMFNEMANAETFDTLEAATEDALVAALYDNDGLWYRARIIQVKEEGVYRVLFIDYGNESDVTVVRSLPEDLVSLPPLAKRCRLEGLPRGEGSCSKVVFTKLSGMVDRAEIFTVTESDRESTDDDVTLISLSYGGGDLLTELMNRSVVESDAHEDEQSRISVPPAEETFSGETKADSNPDEDSILEPEEANAAESVSSICENHRQEEMSKETEAEITSPTKDASDENLTIIDNESEGADEIKLPIDDYCLFVGNNVPKNPVNQEIEYFEIVSGEPSDDKKNIVEETTVQYTADQNAEENLENEFCEESSEVVCGEPSNYKERIVEEISLHYPAEENGDENFENVLYEESSEVIPSEPSNNKESMFEKISVHCPADENAEENFENKFYEESKETYDEVLLFDVTENFESLQKVIGEIKNTEFREFSLDEIENTVLENVSEIPSAQADEILNPNEELVESTDASVLLLSNENSAVSSVGFVHITRESSSDILPLVCESISNEANEISKEVGIEKQGIELNADFTEWPSESELTTEKKNVDFEYQKPIDCTSGYKIQGEFELSSADTIALVVQPVAIIPESSDAAAGIPEICFNSKKTEETGASLAVREIAGAIGVEYEEDLTSRKETTETSVPIPEAVSQSTDIKSAKVSEAVYTPAEPEIPVAISIEETKSGHPDAEETVTSDRIEEKAKIVSAMSTFFVPYGESKSSVTDEPTQVLRPKKSKLKSKAQVKISAANQFGATSKMTSEYCEMTDLIGVRMMESEGPETVKCSHGKTDQYVESSSEIWTNKPASENILQTIPGVVTGEFDNAGTKAPEDESPAPVEVSFSSFATTKIQDTSSKKTENKHMGDESNVAEVENGDTVGTDWFGAFINVSDLTELPEYAEIKKFTAESNHEVKTASVDLEKFSDSNSSVYFDSSSDVNLLNDGFFDESFCYISERKNPSSFYVQKLSTFSRLNEMEEKLRQVCEAELEDAEVGMVAGAKIQNIYLRVKVIDIDTYNGFTVFCIDYGTESTCSSLFKLPPEITNIPPLALHCAIQLPCFLRDWPENVCREFDGIMSTSKPKFSVQIMEISDGVAYVNLFNDGVDIGKKLRAMCDDLDSDSDVFESPAKERWKIECGRNNKYMNYATGAAIAVKATSIQLFIEEMFSYRD